LPADPAARGLDIFIHVSPEAAPGSTFELTAEVFGFATVTQALPLAGAVIEAGWDPESLGGDTPPPSVSTKTDASGRARLAVTMPRGKPEGITLLVAARHGGHSRVRSLIVVRTPPAWVTLHVADARVVPTSTISAWALVIASSGKPLSGVPVVISLLE